MIQYEKAVYGGKGEINMPKQTIPFSDFLAAAGDQHAEFIYQLHAYLQENGCTTEIKEAASGYVVSYMHKPTKRTVANYVFRKKAPQLRVYADHVLSYADTLAAWPESMKNTIRKGGTCKRLIDPAACNGRCLLGFDFILDGERQQKCRYHTSFTFPLDEETKPYLFEIMQHELEARQM